MDGRCLVAKAIGKVINLARQGIRNVINGIRRTWPRGAGVNGNRGLEWNARNFGPNWPGTRVPRGFTLEVGGQTYQVHPNATKHLAEYVRAGPGGAGFLGDFPISPLADAVHSAQRRGLSPGRNFIRVGPWELGIDTDDNVIYTANGYNL